jgi:hypothetical protein
MELSPRARRTVATVLAVVLAVESVSAVVAAAGVRTLTQALPEEPPAGQVLAAETAATEDPAVPVPARVVTVTPRPVVAALPAEDRDPPVASGPSAEEIAAAEAAAKARAERIAERRAERERRQAEREAAREAARTAARQAEREEARERAKAAARERDRSPSYRGRNHVWIPSLGISKSIRWFPCERSRPPDNYVYRWGCAGANNVYLMGHAHSVMKPLHDAYVGGRLRKGMKVWYADGNGRVRSYAVRWWKVTRPTTDAAWAWAPQDVPSMTLQTCVGRNSEFRLMVRLTATR